MIGKIREVLSRWKTNRMIGRGVFMLRTGKYERAMDLLDRVIERDPENQMAWTAKGLTFAKLKKYKMAVDAYQKALTMRPSEKEREQLVGLIASAREHLTGG